MFKSIWNKIVTYVRKAVKVVKSIIINDEQSRSEVIPYNPTKVSVVKYFANRYTSNSAFADGMMKTFNLIGLFGLGNGLVCAAVHISLGLSVGTIAGALITTVIGSGVLFGLGYCTGLMARANSLPEKVEVENV